VRGVVRRPILALVVLAGFAAGCPSLAGFVGGDGGTGGADGSTADVRGSETSDDGGDAGASPFQIVHETPDGSTLMTVFGFGSQYVVAAGANYAHAFYDNGTWVYGQEQPGVDVYALWGVSSSDFYQCGVNRGTGMGFIEHNDGTSFASELETPAPLYGIWGTGASGSDTVYATGAGGAVYEKTISDGTWSLLANLPPNPKAPPAPDEPILSGVSGFALGGDPFMEVAADYGLAYFSHPPHWYQTSLMATTTFTYRSVWQAPVPRFQAFFGTNFFGGSLMTERNETSDAAFVDDAGGLVESALVMWTLFSDTSDPTYDGKYMRGVWGTGTRALFAGDMGRVVEVDVSHGAANSTYTQVPSPTAAGLWGVWGSSDKEVWIVGENALILHGPMP
jgi:hypothetical protein